MTDEQKRQIEWMRDEGASYGEIAKALGIPRDTVKSHCRRHLRRRAEARADGVCKCCGAPLAQKPGRKKAKFCSDACRNKWWNAHLEQVQRKAIYEYRCKGCGQPFLAYGNDHRKYCTHECYVRDRFGGDAR